ncbi:hypothetical protein P175DRAFT_0101761 [Aspergillus ochraceoroseus IBT 24754]|uniref:Uncharacterized protein n=1 Tax=Aspergillus ochraceoroseus IBT 24754 TaxID=1392256 RepID=A0A2T5LLQ5_9EURO|nr:uncharacterized protein P175DRAFT_0101761 [Aspergillus ochraceoroseus IBT 24754]PTU17213.1 hypothetical protein P175DRAFT_0101761 [Aspergillus ochraceoroseus IBT 24754]
MLRWDLAALQGWAFYSVLVFMRYLPGTTYVQELSSVDDIARGSSPNINLFLSISTSSNSSSPSEFAKNVRDRPLPSLFLLSQPAPPLLRLLFPFPIRQCTFSYLKLSLNHPLESLLWNFHLSSYPLSLSLSFSSLYSSPPHFLSSQNNSPLHSTSISSKLFCVIISLSLSLSLSLSGTI